MPIYKHRNKAILNRLETIDITEYIGKFIMLHRKDGWCLPPAFGSFQQAEELKILLNEPENTTYKSVRGLDGFYYWDKQLVDFVPSNLGDGRGYLFYFICNCCGGRVKYLYQYSYCDSPLCRTCCHLSYKTPSRRERNLSRLFRKPLISSESRYAIAQYAGITAADLPS